MAKYDGGMMAEDMTVQGSIVPRPQAGLASIAHWSYLMAWVVPFANLIIPIILLNTTGKTDAFVRENAIEALNLFITVFIYTIISVILIFVAIGIVLLIALAVCCIIFPIIAAIQTMGSTMETPVYRYPLIFRFIQ